MGKGSGAQGSRGVRSWGLWEAAGKRNWGPQEAGTCRRQGRRELGPKVAGEEGTGATIVGVGLEGGLLDLQAELPSPGPPPSCMCCALGHITQAPHPEASLCLLGHSL